MSLYRTDPTAMPRPAVSCTALALLLVASFCSVSAVAAPIRRAVDPETGLESWQLQADVLVMELNQRLPGLQCAGDATPLPDNQGESP